MRNHRFSIVTLSVVLVLAVIHAVAATDKDAGPATATVERVQTALLDVMKNGAKLGLKGRYAQLEPVITQTHDFDFVTPRVFGRDWQPLTDDQKHTIAELYRRISVMTFAREFNEFHGERFEVLDGKRTSDGDWYVRTVMHTPDGNKVQFNYLLHQSGGQWRIVNTVFDGASGLSMDRSRYQPLLHERGADALIAQLRKQAEGEP